MSEGVKVVEFSRDQVIRLLQVVEGAGSAEIAGAITEQLNRQRGDLVALALDRAQWSGVFNLINKDIEENSYNRDIAIKISRSLRA